MSGKIVFLTLRVILGLLFLLVGFSKVVAHPGVVALFATWGYAAWFARLVGIVEMTAGLGLLVPLTVRYAAWTLLAVMAGAAVTHGLAAEWSRGLVVGPIAAGLVAVLLLDRRSGTPSSDET